MAQLKDLLVSGAARFLNGIFVLGTSSMNDTNPAETETYSLGTNNLKWKNIYGKDGYIANVHATNLYDAGGTTTVADKYISTLAVKPKMEQHLPLRVWMELVEKIQQLQFLIMLIM